MSWIDRLSQDERDMLAPHARRWEDIALGAAATDRPRAEDAVRRTYRAAGLKAPEIVWCGSPAAAADAFRNGRRAHGSSVRGDVLGALQGAVLKRISWSVWQEVANNVCTVVRNRVWDRVGLHVARDLGERSDSALAQGFLVQYGAGLAASYDYFRSVLGLEQPTRQIEPLIALCMSAGLVLPCARVCYLSERAGRAHMDAGGRLHRDDGPALVWTDGTALHAWRGMLVPRLVIEAPEALEFDDIEQMTRNAEIRRAVIERVGHERYLAAAQARLASTDETGKLWVKRFADGGAWAVVEVVNGTPEPDGTCKTYYLRVPPTMRSARAAVAWTYGLSEAEYTRVKRT